MLRFGDDRDEVGVAAALADAVDGALDVARAGGDGGQRVRNRQFAVVVRVDAEGDVHGPRRLLDDGA